MVLNMVWDYLRLPFLFFIFASHLQAGQIGQGNAAGDGHLLWIDPKHNGVCTDENGITLEGVYLGRGSTVSIIDSSPSGVYKKVRVIGFKDLGLLPPIGWKKILGEGDEGWTFANAIRKGGMADYIKDIADNSSKNEPQPLKITLCPLQEDREAAIDFFSGIDLPSQMRDGLDKSLSVNCFDMIKRKKQSLEDIFFLLSLTERGRDFLADFLPGLASGRIKVKTTQSPEALNLPSPPGSLAFYFQSTLYVDFISDMGRLLPIFMHEGIHAIDLAGSEPDAVLANFTYLQAECDTLQRNIERLDINDVSETELKEFSSLCRQIGPLRKDKDRILVSTEHKAFRAHNTLIDQLRRRYPSYKKAIDYFISSQLFSSYPLSEGEFRLKMEFEYHIDRRFIDEHFARYGWEDFD